MNQGELKTLEEKTRKIVETLEALDSEAERQEQASKRIEDEREDLHALASSLRDVSTELASVLAMLRQSTPAEVIEAMNGARETSEQSGAEIRELRGERAERDREIDERIAAIEAVIGRIDRNTQKGIGRERG